VNNEGKPKSKTSGWGNRTCGDEKGKKGVLKVLETTGGGKPVLGLGQRWLGGVKNGTVAKTLRHTYIKQKKKEGGVTTRRDRRLGWVDLVTAGLHHKQVVLKKEVVLWS